MLPETYPACRVALPMLSATCGVPVTVTGSLKPTVTSITSSAMKRPSAPCPVPESETPVTVGATWSAAAPFTVKPLWSPSAWVPRSRVAALPAASAMAPPFRPSAEAPTAIPLESVSALTTA